MDPEILAQLQSREKVFEGLMSLTPADTYHGKNNEDQWQRKKQTKEQKRAAKKAKLDPSSNKSALDVHREGVWKRKREHDADDRTEKENSQSTEPNQPAKKQRMENCAHSISHVVKSDLKPEDDSAKRKAKADRRREKRQQKKAKEAKRQERVEKRKGQKPQSGAQLDEELSSKISNLEATEDPEFEDDSLTNDGIVELEDIEPVDVEGIVGESDERVASSEASDSATGSPIFDETDRESKSIASSLSSIVHSSSIENSKSWKDSPKLPRIDSELLQERLRTRIEALRAARKADGINGKPARNRQELIEARRRKEDQRRAHKKEIRAQAKKDQLRQEAEEEAARLRGGSGSPSIFSPRSEAPENFSFGRLTFDDGQELNSKLSNLLEPKKKKGASDPRTALQAAERKSAKLNGFDERKRADIQEKEHWLQAKKRIHGEKQKDDVSLLKKTLKRKDKGKRKSEKDWNTRIEGVKKGQEVRQRKREDNIQKRKDDKGNKGTGKSAGKPGKSAIKKRPGFEGSFRSSHKPTTH